MSKSQIGYKDDDGDNLMEIDEDDTIVKRKSTVNQHANMLLSRSKSNLDAQKTKKMISKNHGLQNSESSLAESQRSSELDPSMQEHFLPKNIGEDEGNTNQQDNLSSTISGDMIGSRIIKVNSENKQRKKICCKFCFIRASYQMYRNNKVSTGKYNVLNFLPRNLFVQFSKMANLYFLVMCIMEVYKPISDSGGQPVVALPLAFVVGLSMVKDLFEDVKRHLSDRSENMKKVKVSSKKVKHGVIQRMFKMLRWKEIRVGQIVKVEENEYFPCDLILLNSSQPNGVCYVETKNLDGETNLKHKKADQICVEMCQHDQDALNNFNDSIIECEKENEFIYKFNGQLRMPNDVTVGLGEDQILLRGSSLRNTGFIWGIAVYTGHDSKVMMNSSKSVVKKSKLEIALNHYLIMGMLIQGVLCLTAALYSSIWAWVMYHDEQNTPYYLELQWTYQINSLDGTVQTKQDSNPTYVLNVISSIGLSFGKWILALMNFVAISLLVSLEMVKFFQGIFIEWDYQMYDEEQDSPAKAQSSNLNEELGQVSYIFSDKTGTLTKNIMEFKKFSAGHISYGEDGSLIEGAEELERRKKSDEQGITNVNFHDERFWNDWSDPSSENREYLEKFINILAICHTIVPNMSTDGILSYNASSPDELALTNAARYFGLVFEDRDSANRVIISDKRTGYEQKYELLNVIEFTSLRKRMSVIVRTPEDKIVCMTKGADSIVLARLHAGQDELIETTNGFLEEYAKQGLRTLLLAQREIDPQKYNQWNERYEHALSQLVDREKYVNRVADEIEKDLTLIGSTAIEDKLQDNVAQVISDIRFAGIKFWVLTGDKIETAINIGFSCSVLDEEMEIFIVNETSRSSIQKQLQEFVAYQKQIGFSRETAVVIGGDQLSKITQCPKKEKMQKMLNDFMLLTENSSVVIACRVSPKQKAEVVRLVRKRKELEKKIVTTLAIGDGANDVNMILAAHLGVGISGLEGQQASRAADYSVCQFQHLKNLLFCHGREAYRRNSFLVLYMFYKNVMLVLPIFFFGMFSAFSGTQFYDLLMYNTYNLVFTGMPICWYAVYDWQYSKQTFLDNPQLYKIGLKNKCFNKFIFWRWYVYATWQSFVILLVSLECLDYSTSFGVSMLDIFNKDRRLSDGVIQGSIWIDGTYIMQAIIVLVTVKIFISTSSHTGWSVFFQFGCVVAFYAYIIVFSIIPFNLSDLLGVAKPLLLFITNYLLLFITVVAFSFIDTGMWHIDQQVQMTYDQLEENLEEQQKQKRNAAQMEQRDRKMTGYKHTGFAFDGAAGHDVLVTDNLLRRLKFAADSQFSGKKNLFSFNKWTGDSMVRSSSAIGTQSRQESYKSLRQDSARTSKQSDMDQLSKQTSQLSMEQSTGNIDEFMDSEFRAQSTNAVLQTEVKFQQKKK